MILKWGSIFIALLVVFRLSENVYADIQKSGPQLTVLFGFNETATQTKPLLSPKNSENHDLPMSKQLVIASLIEAKFKSIGVQVHLNVIRGAGVMDFINAKLNPLNAGVIWYSHGAPASVNSRLAKYFDGIPDAYGRDLLPILQALSPKMSSTFTALIACYGKTILQRNHFEWNESSSNFFATDLEVDAKDTIDEVVKRATIYLSEAPNALIASEPDQPSDRVTLKISRSQDNLNLLISVGGKPIGFMFEGQLSTEVKVLRQAIVNPKKDLQISFAVLPSSKNVSLIGAPSFGDIKISSESLPFLTATWEIFKNLKTGVPYGTTQRIFNLF